MDVFAEATADQFNQEVKHLTLGGQNKRSTRISNTPEFAMILAKGLYSDGLRGMVREVICNGWDSHIATGREHIPLKITCEKDKFVVQDFGSGIPDADIDEIYGVFGESTKRKADNQTGGFGLGSKAPFAVDGVVSFFVTSSYDGVTTGYVVTKEDPDTDYLPSITTLFQFPTGPDESTGVTVEVPLTEVLLSKLLDHVKAVLTGGEIPAEVSTVSGMSNEISPPPFEQRLGLKTSETGVCLYNVQKFGPLLPRPHAVMVQLGNVIYPLPFDQMPNSLYRLASSIDNNRVALILKLPNGSCRMAPSREELLWNAQTNAVIQDVVSKFMGAYNETKPRDRRQDILFLLKSKDIERPQLAQINTIQDLKGAVALLRVDRITDSISQANTLLDIRTALSRGEFTHHEMRVRNNLIYTILWGKIQHLEPVKRSIFLKYLRLLAKGKRLPQTWDTDSNELLEYSHKVFQRLYRGNFTVTRVYPYNSSAQFHTWSETRPPAPEAFKYDCSMQHVVVYGNKTEGKHITNQGAWNHHLGPVHSYIYAFRWVKTKTTSKKGTEPGTSREDMIQALETMGALVTDLTPLATLPKRQVSTIPRVTGTRVGYPIYYDCGLDGEDRSKARRCEKPQAYITLNYDDSYLRSKRDSLQKFLPDLVLIASDAGVAKARSANVPSASEWIAQTISAQADNPALAAQLRTFLSLVSGDQDTLVLYADMIQGTPLKQSLGKILDTKYFPLWGIFGYLEAVKRHPKIQAASNKIRKTPLNTADIAQVHAGLVAINKAVKIFQPVYLMDYATTNKEIQKTISGFLGLILKNKKG